MSNNNEFDQYSEALLPGVSEWFNDNPLEKEIITDSKPDWPEKDIKALSEFCKKYKILGFNCGRMHPTAALALLKRQIGVSDPQLAERTPYTNSPTSICQIDHKKTLLHG